VKASAWSCGGSGSLLASRPRSVSERAPRGVLRCRRAKTSGRRGRAGSRAGLPRCSGPSSFCVRARVKRAGVPLGLEERWTMGVGGDVVGVWLGAAGRPRSVSPHTSSGTCAVTQRLATPVGCCFGRVRWRFSTEDRDRSNVGELRASCPFRSGRAAWRLSVWVRSLTTVVAERTQTASTGPPGPDARPSSELFLRAPQLPIDGRSDTERGHGQGGSGRPGRRAWSWSSSPLHDDNGRIDRLGRPADDGVMIPTAASGTVRR